MGEKDVQKKLSRFHEGIVFCETKYDIDSLLGSLWDGKGHYLRNDCRLALPGRTAKARSKGKHSNEEK